VEPPEAALADTAERDGRQPDEGQDGIDGHATGREPGGAIAGPRHAENTDEPSPNAVPLAQCTASSMFSDGIDHDRPERLLHRRAVLRHVASKVADPVAICSVAADIWSISGQLAAWLRGQENMQILA
jgi:hypothetical protein